MIEALRAPGLDYALCGGFALAAYGIVRATEDINLMVEESDLERLRDIVQPMGFWLQAQPLVFKDGQIRIFRLVKTEPASPDFLILDALTVTPATKPAWESRRSVETEFGQVSVISPRGLIELKTLRGSGQDLDDIEKLRKYERGES